MVLTDNGLPLRLPALPAVLVHEERDAGHDEQHEEVLERGVSLPAQQHPQHQHRDGLARLAHHLGRVGHPHQGLVAAHHGDLYGVGLSL